MHGVDVLEERRPTRARAKLARGYPTELERETALQPLFPRLKAELLPCDRGMVGVHANSLTNELCSLYNRVLMEVPTIRAQARRGLDGTAARVQELIFSKVGKLETWPLRRALRHMVVRHGSGLYVPAAKSLSERPLDRRDSGVSMFIKVEKNFIAEGLSLKTPRAIQYRGPRFNLMLAKYLLPYEEKFYAEFQKLNSTGLHTSKGLSPDARANLLAALWSKYSSPAALCLDASRFDAHVSVAHLIHEGRCYTQSLGEHRLLKWLLARQLTNRGKGRWGSRYSVDGCRMSGDMNTALGNTIIQMIVLSYCAGSEPVSLVVEGDDAVMFGDVDVIRRVERTLVARAKEVGFSMKCVRARFLEEISYCSSRLVETQPGVWRSVREGVKAFFTDRYTSKRVEGEKARRSKARTMAVGYATMYAGLPVYGAWAQYLLSWAPACKLDERYDSNFIQRAALAATDRSTVEIAAPAGNIASLTRSSFFAATGIAPSEQLLIERLLISQAGPFPHSIAEMEFKQLLRLRSRLAQ